ncbi:MAG: radical SAM protein [Elusimicrobiota bacterium]
MKIRQKTMPAPGEAAKNAARGAPGIVFLGSACNYDCLFCSGGPDDKTQTAAEIRAVIAARPDTLSIEGGEPTLDRGLPEWVRLARKTGVRDIILCTNGARFGNAAYVRELCGAGVTLFNVNFPSHIEKVFGAITRTSGMFPGCLRALRVLIDTAGGARVRLNCVVHLLSAPVLEDYVRFVRRNFPEVFYIEFNLVKVLGHVKRRRYLVPRLGQIIPRLCAALALADRFKMQCICDGFPLCLLPGHEHCAIDARKLLTGDLLYMKEKIKSPRCAGCTLGALCAGPRADYLRIHGDGEIKASSLDPAPIEARVRKFLAGPQGSR